MATNVRTDMTIVPTRMAPPPPSSSAASSVSQFNGFLRNNSSYPFTMQPMQKKKPPPRPPPPKFNRDYALHHKDQKPKKPPRPTELLSNLFNRKSSKHNFEEAHFQKLRGATSTHSSSSVNNGINEAVLIDLSPPGSPTFTTHSSSDAVSIDSFGSDGNSNPSVFTSSGNTSQTESGFEDDFDFFGLSFANARKSQPQKGDPWKLNSGTGTNSGNNFYSQDPFSSNFTKNNTSGDGFKRIGDSCFFPIGDTRQVPSKQTSMPTIIRAKPPKPPAPKILQEKLTKKVLEEKKQFSFDSFQVPPIQPTFVDFNSAWNDAKDTGQTFNDNPSPPMPSVSPPPPPLEYLMSCPSEDGSEQNNKEPHGIALYDFPATQEGDLELKEGDTVLLIKAINSDWMEGQVGYRKGMFPANFIEIKVPLAGDSVDSNVVKALYTFKGETWQDLSFQEGDKITVLSRISDDWLYGECRGKQGHFPANHVDRVPSNL